MTAIVRAINLPGTILPPTKEYRHIPPLPAGIVKSTKRQEKMLQKSRERGGAAHKKLGPEEIEKRNQTAQDRFDMEQDRRSTWSYRRRYPDRNQAARWRIRRQRWKRHFTH